MTGLLYPEPGNAYLSIIRQGRDSRGTIEEDDFFGKALAVGDFNHDEIDDLAIAAPNERYNGKDEAGAVIVVYGSPRGLTEVGADLLTADTAGVLSQIGAQFGFALAAGDFNGDEFDDLAVGEPYADVNGTPNAGRVYVFLGQPGGLGSVGAISFDQSYASVTVEDDDEFGGALATGFFNSDGYADLAVGSPGEDSGAGAVFYFPGDPDLVVAGSPDSKWFKQNTLGGSSIAGDKFGHALATGNLYDSPQDDLAVGAPQKTVDAIERAGQVYLLRGSAAGGLMSTNAKIYSANDVGDGVDPLGWFGRALAVGQFADGDYRLLAIGEPGREIDLWDAAGRVVVVKGSASGLDFSPGSRWILDQNATASAAEGGDKFGWALAAGNFDNDVSGYDDLGIAAPHEFEGAPFAGVVHVFLGGALAIVSPDTLTYTQEHLSDESRSNEQLGYALAFGKFDDTGRANLVAGAPGQHDAQITFELPRLNNLPLKENAGCVFIIAPWRQALRLSTRHAAVTNGAGELVFGQRPFDRVRNASTGKILYAYMLATEGHPGYPNLDALYTVPEWIPDNSGSWSQAEPPLMSGERVSLLALMQLLMWHSASDCALAIADVVEEDTPPNNVSLFLERMNQVAIDIGLEDTRWLDGERISRHYSTPEDMVRMWRVAMEEAVVADVVSTDSAQVARPFGIGRFMPVSMTWAYNDNYTKYRDNLHLGFSVDGVKSGALKNKDQCRIVSMTRGGGRMVVGMFGLDSNVTARDIYRDFDELFTLARSLAVPPMILTESARSARDAQKLVSDISRPPMIDLAGISTEEDTLVILSSEYGDGESDSTDVEILQDAGATPAALDVWIGRQGAVGFVGTGQSASLSLEPFQSHFGFRLANAGSNTASITVAATHPELMTTYVIAPEEEVSIPAYSGVEMVPSFNLTLLNESMDSSVVVVKEAGYEFPLTLAGVGESFTCRFVNSPGLSPLAISVLTIGHDPNPGNTVSVLAGSPGATSVVAVGDPVGESVNQKRFRVTSTWPNPFAETVRFSFELPFKAQVEATIYDVGGREVRLLVKRGFQPGLWVVGWDACDQRGLPLGAGVYFYRFRLDGIQVASGKVVLLR
jgi:D-alanyl-D-alanine carboxypeptidase